MDEVRRVYIRVSGRVQGVGFRFFTHRAAQRVGLVGYVRNMPNGDVEAEAQGLREDIEAFLCQVRRGPSASRVKRVDVHDRPLNPRDTTFVFRYF
jgi:acylphosphatase